MPFALQSFEPISVGLRRLLGEQLAGALRHLLAQAAPAGEAADPVESVHEARKCLKKSRTLLRLARRAIGQKAAADLNARLREVGQKLAPFRDQHMLIETVERLARRTASSPYSEALTPVQAALRALHPVYPLPEDLVQAIVSELRAIAAAAETLIAEQSDRRLHRSLERGLVRMLRRGQRAYFLAYSEPSDEHFHEWRKRVKDVFYTACLLHPTRPQKLAAWVDSLDQLSEDLGDEHDLGILARALHEQPVADAAATALTVQLIARQRDDLRATARLGGDAMYRDSARATARFMTRRLRRRASPRLTPMH